MNEKSKSLMKIFSLVLKNRAKSDLKFKEISPEIGKFFSRKELIEIITKIHGGNLPPDLNLVEMENESLLELIGDDMFILAYVSEKWCQEVIGLPNKPPVASPPNSGKPTGTPNGKKNEKNETGKEE